MIDGSNQSDSSIMTSNVVSKPAKLSIMYTNGTRFPEWQIAMVLSSDEVSAC